MTGTERVEHYQYFRRAATKAECPIRRIAALSIACAAIALSHPALGEDMTWLAGTYEVAFQPVQSAGKKNGCSLVFKAIALDYGYQNGRPTLLNGNITFSVFGQNPGLSLKLGLGDALAQSMKLEPPHLAYLQTESGTTASSMHSANDLDVPGYRLYIYRIDQPVLKVLTDMMEGRELTLGFNRRKDGIDILFPLDLTVEAASFEGREVRRKRSNKAIEAFSACFLDVAKGVK